MAAADVLAFGGGLNNTDVFGFGTGVAGTAGATAAFNLSAYLGCVQLRQNQVYQEKNFHLSWVSVARDDIRSLMEASVNRMNNYVLVGTLILQTAIGMLFGDTLSTTSDLFIVAIYWQTMALSIMFFTTSIVFSVKGQNRAFLNTMRLLTWETRPENPSAYDHDYMAQVKHFERSGFGQIFRLPGMAAARYDQQQPATSSSGPAGKAASKAAGSSKGEEPQPLDPTMGIAAGFEPHDAAAGRPNLEVLETRTDQLVYLARMGQVMQVWLAYDLYSKYCLGFGLVLMIKSAIYWCLGQLAQKNTQLDHVTAVILVVIFTFLDLVVYREAFGLKFRLLAVCLTTLLVVEPLSALLHLFYGGPYWIKTLFRIINVLSHISLFVAGYIWTLGALPRPARAASKYLVGPAGQRFSSRWIRPHSSDDEDYDAHGRKSFDATDETLRACTGRYEDSDAGRSWYSDSEEEGSGSTCTGSDSSENETTTSYGSSEYNSDESSGRDSGPQKTPQKSAAAGRVGSFWRGRSWRGVGRRRINGNHGSPSADDERRQRRRRRRPISAEERMIADVEMRVSRVFRFELAFSALVWVSSFAVVVLSDVGDVGFIVQGAAATRLELRRVAMTWHSPLFIPSSLACFGTSVFAANEFQVARLDLEAHTSTPYPCPGANATIRDLTLACTQDRSACRPLALLNDSRIIDCDTGDSLRLLQMGDMTIQRIALQVETGEEDIVTGETVEFGRRLAPASSAGGYNGSLIGASGNNLVVYSWKESAGGWAPQFVIEADEPTRIASRSCSSGALNRYGCVDGDSSGRRLRSISGKSIRSHGGAGADGTARRKWRQAVVQRSGRIGVVDNIEEEVTDEEARLVIQNMAFTSAGLLLFQRAVSRRGWQHLNVIKLLRDDADDPFTWYFPDERSRIAAGCGVNESHVLVLQGYPQIQLWTADLR